jgi:hypothetical protein
VGGTWIARVDTTGSDPSGFRVSALGAWTAGLDPGVTIGIGEILVDIFAGQRLFVVSRFGPLGAHDYAVPIPPDPILIGATASAQAMALGAVRRGCATRSTSCSA